MKRLISKSILLGIDTMMSAALLVGGVFASYIVTKAPDVAVRIGVKAPTYYLFKGSEASGLKLDYNESTNLLEPSTSEDPEDFENIELAYNESLTIKYSYDESSFIPFESSFTASEEGKYTFSSYNMDSSNYTVTQEERAIYVYAHHSTKVYPSLNLYAWESSDDSKNNGWPGVSMERVTLPGTVTDTNHIRVFKTYIDVDYDRVIVDTPYACTHTSTTYYAQTANLTVPTNKHQATVNLVALSTTSNESWQEYPTSFAHADQESNSSEAYLRGTMSGPWEDWPDYTFDWIGSGYSIDGNEGICDVVAITVTLNEGTIFGANYHAWAGYNSDYFSSSYFKQNGSNIEVKDDCSGVYRFIGCHIYKDNNNYFWFIHAEKVS